MKLAMDDKLLQIIDESIELELNVSKIYFQFYNALPEDSDFWWRLAIEERNHAALISSAKEAFVPKGIFPESLIANSLQALRETNKKLKELILHYEHKPPTRQEAFNTAYRLEHWTGELHFQKFMESPSNSEVEEIFKQLNKQDRDHARRIYEYMKKHGIPLEKDNTG